MISLAPWKYRNILSDRGGPIDRILTGTFQAPDGQSFWEAYAFLNAHCIPKAQKSNCLYGSCDGTGTSKNKLEAIHIAISEALERWAFVATSECSGYGFEIDPSTTGMACFPGITKSRVQKSSFLEAAERRSLIEWWQGRLNHRISLQKGPIQVIEINQPFKECRIVILRQKVAGDTMTSYGFAAGLSLDRAISKAQVELNRNSRILTSPNFQEKVETIRNIQEKRILFFAGRSGTDLFENRLLPLPKATTTPRKQLIVNKEIKGPWTQYATVWRSLIEGDYQHIYSSKEEFFYF